MKYTSIIPQLEIEHKLERTWRTKDGTRVKLRDMDERHLYRVIKIIEERALTQGYPITEYFDDTKGHRGEVVVGYHDPLKSLELYYYQDFVDVYNYRFGEEADERS